MEAAAVSLFRGVGARPPRAHGGRNAAVCGGVVSRGDVAGDFLGRPRGRTPGWAAAAMDDEEKQLPLLIFHVEKEDPSGFWIENRKGIGPGPTNTKCHLKTSIAPFSFGLKPIQFLQTIEKKRFGHWAHLISGTSNFADHPYRAWIRSFELHSWFFIFAPLFLLGFFSYVFLYFYCM
ncbi:uncharacterized protein HKW66_Vig0200390 [Vigna angularis]|uniref:Uncharacterized protein n=2 Tax=Phaseolus angularis TaxID=3914 RepID=A0A8T0JU02_PHAAN|nr:uncharacterized protein HKW66_Vig0200390 [Vigna angularis]BAT97463.1 hypothetical protein VIGAN_09091200 [Vigna angularis var. angularis]